MCTDKGKKRRKQRGQVPRKRGWVAPKQNNEYQLPEVPFEFGGNEANSGKMRQKGKQRPCATEVGVSSRAAAEDSACLAEMQEQLAAQRAEHEASLAALAKQLADEKAARQREEQARHKAEALRAQTEQSQALTQALHRAQVQAAEAAAKAAADRAATERAADKAKWDALAAAAEAKAQAAVQEQRLRDLQAHMNQRLAQADQMAATQMQFVQSILMATGGSMQPQMGLPNAAYTCT